MSSCSAGGDGANQLLAQCWTVRRATRRTQRQISWRLVFPFRQERTNGQAQGRSVFPETAIIRGRAYVGFSLPCRCSVSRLPSVSGCASPPRRPEPSWESSTWTALESSVWLHPERFTCWCSGTTRRDTLQENLTENRWQMSGGLAQLRKQRSKPSNKVLGLGPEFRQQAEKWSPPLCPLAGWNGRRLTLRSSSSGLRDLSAGVVLRLMGGWSHSSSRCSFTLNIL